MRGPQIAVWDRASDPEIFENGGHGLAVAIVATCIANIAGTAGETFAITAQASIGGTSARSSMRLRIEGDVTAVEEPTTTGVLEQTLRHNEFLMRMAMQGSAGTIETLARMNESLLTRNDTLEQKRQQHLDEREEFQGAKHERELEANERASRKAQRNELARHFIGNVLPLVTARLAGGLPTGAGVGGASSPRSQRERLLDALLGSIAEDEAKLSQLATLLTPERIAMLSELGRGMEHAGAPTETPPGDANGVQKP